MIQLKIPFVIEQETISQKKEEAVNLFTAAQHALHNLAGSPSLTSEESDKIHGFETRLKELGKTAASARIVETWNYWKNQANTETLGFSSAQAENAFLDYIDGTGAVSLPKNRKDLPDAFIYQQIRELADGGKVTVITGDKRFGKALEGLVNVTVFEKLSEFLDSSPVRELFLQVTEKEMENDPSLVLNFIRNNADILQTCILAQGGDKIVGIELPEDPSGNTSEPTISSYDDPSDIVFDFEGLKYYGGGEYGLPFEFKSDVWIDFFIDKSEYWNLNEENQPSVSDWNDYVYQAESEDEVRVRGILKISAPLDVFEKLMVGSDDVDMSSFDIVIDSIISLETTS